MQEDLTSHWLDLGVMQFAIGLALDAQIPAVNARFCLLSQVSLAATARRMTVEAVKERLVLITCTSDLVHAATPPGLLDHHLPALLRYQELSRSLKLRPLVH